MKCEITNYSLAFLSKMMGISVESTTKAQSLISRKHATKLEDVPQNIIQLDVMDVPSASIILCTWHISSFVTYCPTVKHPRIQVDPTRFTSWYMFILMQKGIKV